MYSAVYNCFYESAITTSIVAHHHVTKYKPLFLDVHLCRSPLHQLHHG